MWLSFHTKSGRIRLQVHIYDMLRLTITLSCSSFRSFSEQEEAAARKITAGIRFI